MITHGPRSPNVYDTLPTRNGLVLPVLALAETSLKPNSGSKPTYSWAHMQPTYTPVAASALWPRLSCARTSCTRILRNLEEFGEDELLQVFSRSQPKDLPPQASPLWRH